MPKKQTNRSLAAKKAWKFRKQSVQSEVIAGPTQAKGESAWGYYWRKLLYYIEAGDLIPFMILVSLYHYAAVLNDKDPVIIASAIGVAVDLGHYRIIKATLRHGRFWWLAALVTTVIAFFYHLAFYLGGTVLTLSFESASQMSRALLFAVPIPVFILLLAALSYREKWTLKFKEK